MRVRVLGIALACGLALTGCDDASPEPSRPAAHDGAPRDARVDLAAHPMAPPAGARGTLLLFLGVDCPISNAYAPALRALQREVEPRGVRVHRVYADPAVTLREAEIHGEDYDLPRSFVRDPRQQLASACGIAVTPEAALLDADGRLVYVGRIDDTWADLGARREAPARRDLEEAVRALLTGGRVAATRTPAVGCALPARLEEPARTTLGFADVAPLIHARCAGCHHDGGSAPFELRTHADVVRHARQIRVVTERRLMPPWKPAPGVGAFVGERHLDDAELARLHEWLDAGAPLGPAGDVPPPERPGDAWQLGEPDLIVAVPDGFDVPAAGGDIWRSFVAPTPLDHERFVEAVEFRVSNPRVTHHAALHVDAEGRARAADAAAPGPGYPGMELHLPADHGGLDGFIPGLRAQPLPAGLAWRLAPRADLVFAAHFQPTGKPEHARFEVGLHFADAPPERALGLARLTAAAINILPGDADYRVSDSFELPVDAQVVALLPHAHRLARDVRVDARDASGAVTPLIHIPDWDFNWQDAYRCREPVVLEAGTRLEMHVRYDNSQGNPRNPRHPPRRVIGGRATRDEMALVWVQLAVAHEDLPRLVAAQRAHLEALFEDAHLETLWGLLVAEVDRDGDGLLDPAEELAAAAFLEALPARTELRDRFFDHDGDGELDASERRSLERFVELWRTGAR